MNKKKLLTCLLALLEPNHYGKRFIAKGFESFFIESVKYRNSSKAFCLCRV